MNYLSTKFSWWRELSIFALSFSLLLSIAGWPDSWIGVAINVVLLIVFLLIRSGAWRILPDS